MMRMASLIPHKSLIFNVQDSIIVMLISCAGVVELADTQDLGSCAFERAGSSPAFRTRGSTPPGVGTLVHRAGAKRTEAPAAPVPAHGEAV